MKFEVTKEELNKHFPDLELTKGYYVLNGEKKDYTRTGSQNRALHKNCDIIAQKLNDAGLDMKAEVWKFNLPWTTESVKKHLWKFFQKKITNKESTTQLDKWGEIDLIHDTIMRELGEKFEIEYHDFPCS